MQRDGGLHLLSVNELSRCWPDVAKEEGGGGIKREMSRDGKRDSPSTH